MSRRRDLCSAIRAEVCNDPLQAVDCQATLGPIDGLMKAILGQSS